MTYLAGLRAGIDEALRLGAPEHIALMVGALRLAPATIDRILEESNQ